MRDGICNRGRLAVVECRGGWTDDEGLEIERCVVSEPHDLKHPAGDQLLETVAGLAAAPAPAKVPLCRDCRRSRAMTADERRYSGPKALSRDRYRCVHCAAAARAGRQFFADVGFHEDEDDDEPEPSAPVTRA